MFSQRAKRFLKPRGGVGVAIVPERITVPLQVQNIMSCPCLKEVQDVAAFWRAELGKFVLHHSSLAVHVLEADKRCGVSDDCSVRSRCNSRQIERGYVPGGRSRAGDRQRSEKPAAR